MVLSCLIYVYPTALRPLGGYAWFWTPFQNLERVMAVPNPETHAFNKTDIFDIKTHLKYSKTHFFSFLHTDK